MSSGSQPHLYRRIRDHEAGTQSYTDFSNPSHSIWLDIQTWRKSAGERTPMDCSMIPLLISDVIRRSRTILLTWVGFVNFRTLYSVCWEIETPPAHSLGIFSEMSFWCRQHFSLFVLNMLLVKGPELQPWLPFSSLQSIHRGHCWPPWLPLSPLSPHLLMVAATMSASVDGIQFREMAHGTAWPAVGTAVFDHDEDFSSFTG